MEDLTLPSRRCPRCGRTLPADSPEGLCAACLFAGGTDTLTGSASDDDAPTVLPNWADSAADDGLGQQLAAGQLWGPYRIGRLLGRGGMGEVYEAEHTETGRRIALKVLRSRLRNAEDRARFLREGQLAASVSHPHTVYIFGSEEIAGMPVISMELLPGGTLKDRVVSQGPLRPTEAVSAVLDIVGGLDAAQSAGILHRDIKPSNCFLDTEGAVKVGDFGLSISTLARDVRHNLSTGGFEGTPQFAPPEQLRGEPLDVRADIYAVGATLYYLLTGQTPFDARDLQDLFARVTTEPPKSPRLLRGEIPPGLAAVVVQCLAKKPGDRPASYPALADALRPYSSREDLPARPGSRLMAGVLDSLIITLPVGVSLTSLDNPAVTAAKASVWTWLVYFAYYLVLEGLFGASLGKRLFGLRVTLADGAAAPWRCIARRTAVFYLPNLLTALLVVAGAVAVDTTLAANARAAATMALVAALFLTARRHNGWAAVHDLASGTRVVSRSAVAQRLGTAPEVVPAGPVSAAARLRYGPFIAVTDAGETGDRLIVGFDPVLRRRVWIHTVPSLTPAISPARRDVSRAGRLFWLTGRRSDGENWDAFESPDGEPLLARQRPAVGWPIVKLWLLDLAHELAAAARDGSVPSLGLDRVWLRNDGHVVLLDFPPPAFAGASRTSAPASTRPAPDGANLTPVGLLSAVARHGLNHPALHNPVEACSARSSVDALKVSGRGAGSHVRGDDPPSHVASDCTWTATPMPLSARVLLERWSSPTPPSLGEARTALVNVAAAPDRVWRWRRAIPIALASAPLCFVLAAMLLLLRPMYRFLSPQNAEMIGLLDALREPNPPAESGLTDPEYRDAVETYVAGRYGARLHEEGVWNATIMRVPNNRDRRRIADESAARHPSVSVEALARATAITAPQRERAAERRRHQPGVDRLAAIIIGVLAALSVLLALGCSVVSSVLVPGGVVTRLLGLAVVTRDGTEISRWRSLVRLLVGWLPALAWLAWLAASIRIQDWVPTRAASLPVAGLALGALALGAAWTIARPTRGPHDWLMGTWIVSR